jgi:hypothetical protein
MNATASDIRELRTLEEFQASTTEGTGFLIVTDRSTPTHVHRAKCPAVQAQHFVTKVIKNAGKRGRYYLAPTLEAAQARFRSGRLCAVCHPERT